MNDWMDRLMSGLLSVIYEKLILSIYGVLLKFLVERYLIYYIAGGDSK